MITDYVGRCCVNSVAAIFDAELDDNWWIDLPDTVCGNVNTECKQVN